MEPCACAKKESAAMQQADAKEWRSFIIWENITDHDGPPN